MSSDIQNGRKSNTRRKVNYSSTTNSQQIDVQTFAYASTSPRNIYQYEHQSRSPQKEKLEKLLVPTYRMQPPVKENTTDPWVCAVNNLNSNTIKKAPLDTNQSLLVFRDVDDDSCVSGWSQADLISKTKSSKTNQNKTKKNYKTNRWSGAVNALSKLKTYSHSENNETTSILPNFIKQSRQSRSRQQKQNSKLKLKRSSKASQKHVSLPSPTSSQLASPIASRDECMITDNTSNWLNSPLNQQTIIDRTSEYNVQEYKMDKNHSVKRSTKMDKKKKFTNKKSSDTPKKFTFSDPDLSSPGSSIENHNKMDDFADFQQYEDPSLQDQTDVFTKEQSSKSANKIFTQYEDPPLWSGFEESPSNNPSPHSIGEEDDFFPVDDFEEFAMQQINFDPEDEKCYDFHDEGIDEYDDDTGTLSTRPYDEKFMESKVDPMKDNIQNFNMMPIQNASEDEMLMYTVAAIVIQTNVRRFLAFNLSLDKKWAIQTIQYNYRLYKYRQRREIILNLAATTIQSCYRSWVVRDFLLVDHYCAIQIQSCIRGFLARLQLQKKVNDFRDELRISNTVKIQACYRGYALRKKIIEHSSAMYIQTSWRCYNAHFNFELKKIGAVLIQAYTRRYLVQRQLAYIHSSATKIQSIWRSYCCVIEYIYDLADILIVQSVVRRWLAQRYVSKKHEKRNSRKKVAMRRHRRLGYMKQEIEMKQRRRDPYYGSSFKNESNSPKTNLTREYPSRHMIKHYQPSMNTYSRESENIEAEKSQYLQGIAQDPYFIPD